MSRPLPVALVQASPHRIDEPWGAFGTEVSELVADLPATRLVVYPELHLHGADGPVEERNRRLADAAVRLDDPRLKELGELAGDLGIWLVPGSLCERGADGNLYNTVVVLSPAGELVAQYRKIFPWRPYEPYHPGDRFVTFELDDLGRVGLSICYDAWFPELTRHLAWMGAEVVVNVVKTTTADRAQELVLARANAIVNQVFMVSVNAAAPVGVGQSLVVDPEGLVRVAAPSEAPTVLTDVLDLDHVARARQFGTAGLNRMWDQFRPDDEPVALPLYEGRIDPARWGTGPDDRPG
jgi:predicted amidohydrolase